MNPEALRNALSMIAREQVLGRRDLLDTMGRPERLRKNPSPAPDRLVGIGRAILGNLPEDLASRFPDFSEDDDGMVGAFHAAAGVLLVLRELQAPDGTIWISAVCGTVYRGVEEAVSGVSESVHVLINRLNMNDDGAAWATAMAGDSRVVMRICGAAHRLDEGIYTWFELVAYLLVTAIAASERGQDALGPGTSYLELVSRSDALEGFSADELVTAALAFRRSFPEDLARVVLIERIDGGVGVSIPFIADGEVQALTVLLTVGVPGNGPTGGPGLQIASSFYETMATSDAYRWTRTFNGDDDSSGNDDMWDQTTPWLLGAWQTLEVEHDNSAIFYRGFVPDALRGHVGLEDLIRGVLQEVWVSANKYRLHEEFEETIRSSHGNLQS